MGILLGLSSGVFHSLMSLTSKKVLQDADQYVVAFSYALFSLPFFVFALFWFGLSPTNTAFWYATVVSALLSSAALVLMMYALKVGDLSYVAPFLAFTPAFLIPISAVMLGEMPTAFGIVGVVLVTVGAYVLSFDPKESSKNLLSPVRGLFNNKGALAALSVALIYAVSSNFNKIAVENADPLTYVFFVQILNVLILFPVMIFPLGHRERVAKLVKHYKPLLIVGFFVAAALLAQMTALNFLLVSYVISLKRTSVLFSVLLGFLVFREKNSPFRFLGSAIMVSGVFLIVTD